MLNGVWHNPTKIFFGREALVDKLVSCLEAIMDIGSDVDHFLAVVGASGSGKSSLAFDTIYAEGQRRYIETFSAYARQFLGGLERPA